MKLLFITLWCDIINVTKSSSQKIVVSPRTQHNETFNTYHVNSITVEAKETVDHQYWKAKISINYTTGNVENNNSMELYGEDGEQYCETHNINIYQKTLYELLIELNNSDLLRNIMGNYSLVKPLLTEVVKDIEEELVFV